MDETEAKYRLENLEAIRRRLQQAAARPAGRVLERNSLFDRPEGSLRAADCGLRIRIARPIDGLGHPLAGTPTKSTLTYKGPRRQDAWKRRREIELTIDDADAAGDLLVALGFVSMLSFEKRRETWRLGDCLVELDELPHLGFFVEIEGPPDAIGRVAGLLGLADQPQEKDTYAAMLDNLVREKNIAGKEINFSA
jgi:adenylate cyclase class 2